MTLGPQLAGSALSFRNGDLYSRIYAAFTPHLRRFDTHFCPFLHHLADEAPLTGRSSRGVGRSSSNGRAIVPPPSYARAGAAGASSHEEELQTLETEAYANVLRAFRAQKEHITEVPSPPPPPYVLYHWWDKHCSEAITWRVRCTRLPTRVPNECKGAGLGRGFWGGLGWCTRTRIMF